MAYWKPDKFAGSTHNFFVANLHFFTLPSSERIDIKVIE